LTLVPLEYLLDLDVRLGARSRRVHANVHFM
jgi:hypothetical protein